LSPENANFPPGAGKECKLNHKLFEKLIRLSSSDNDHEALGALRRALAMVDNDLWGYIEKSSRGSYGGAGDSREIARLTRELQAARDAVQNLSKQVAELRKKRAKTGGIELDAYLLKEGFFAIHYEVLLAQWVDDLGIKSSKDPRHWMPVATIKQMFERTLGDLPEDVSVKKFSQAFALAIGKKAVKGGKSKDIMGFTVNIQR
jgi:hypothetical protein